MFIVGLSLYSLSVYSLNTIKDDSLKNINKIEQVQNINEEQEKTSMTFAIIKPDAVLAKKAGQIISIIELNDIEIVRIEKRKLSKEEAQEFYIEHKGKSFYDSLVATMTSAEVYLLALRFKGLDAVQEWRTLIGATNPNNAKAGTIRKMHGKSGSENGVHGSDSDASAARELKFFFGKDILEKNK